MSRAAEAGLPTVIIVTGHLLVDPAGRASYLEGCREVVAQARATEGCLDFSLSADLLDEARIDICEVWATAEALEAFRGSGPSGDQQDAIRGATVHEHRVSASRSLT